MAVKIHSTNDKLAIVIGRVPVRKKPVLMLEDTKTGVTQLIASFIDEKAADTFSKMLVRVLEAECDDET